MSFFNSKHPLGLPRGSVRALLALMLTAATVVSAFKQPMVAVGLLTLTTIVIKDYFELGRVNGNNRGG